MYFYQYSILKEENITNKQLFYYNVLIILQFILLNNIWFVAKSDFY